MPVFPYDRRPAIDHVRTLYAVYLAGLPASGEELTEHAANGLFLHTLLSDWFPDSLNEAAAGLSGGGAVTYDTSADEGGGQILTSAFLTKELIKLATGGMFVSRDDESGLTRLLARFEATGRVYITHTPGFAKGGGGYGDPDNYALLAAVLSLGCLGTRSRKTLNALLKLNDALIEIVEARPGPVTFPLTLFSLTAEARMIGELYDAEGYRLPAD